MKKLLLPVLVIIAVAVIVYFVWQPSTSTTTNGAVIRQETVIDVPVTETIVETVKIEGFEAKLSALLAQKFPLEEQGLLVVKLSSPQVKFDASSQNLLILMDGQVSRPNSSVRQQGPVTAKADLRYDANSKSLVLDNVKFVSFALNTTEGQLSDKAGSIVSVLIGKAMDDLQVVTSQENSQLKKLAADSLKNFQITDNGTLIIPVKQ